MGYKKPICDCENELFLRKEVRYEEEYSINKNGSKGKYIINTSSIGTYSGNESLVCNYCNEAYEVNYDDKSRIIRGSKV